jgi:hypothetical protein
LSGKTVQMVAASAARGFVFVSASLRLRKPSPIQRTRIKKFMQEQTMATNDKPVQVDHVTCEMCLKVVPLSEAKVPEATDYFVHFCGIECYEKWKSQDAKPEDPTRTAKAPP